MMKKRAMFSDHLKPIDTLPVNWLLLVAAGLVLACQLAAMVLVAEGQVEKAQLRQASQASLQTAVANCLENQQGSVIRDCARLAFPPTTTDPESVMPLPHSASNGAGTPGSTFLTLFNRY